jgi:hypothetical protein
MQVDAVGFVILALTEAPEAIESAVIDHPHLPPPSVIEARVRPSAFDATCEHLRCIS